MRNERVDSSAHKIQFIPDFQSPLVDIRKALQPNTPTHVSNTKPLKLNSFSVKARGA